MGEKIDKFNKFRGVTRAEFTEAFDVALIVAGTITIPHLREAHAVLQELES